MTNRKGPKYEVDLLNYFRDEGIDTERLRLTGREDEGDLLVRLYGNQRFVIEAKNWKSLDLAGWIKEASVERLNYAMHRGIKETDLKFPGFIVVHKARFKSISQSYVTTTLQEWVANR